MSSPSFVDKATVKPWSHGIALTMARDFLLFIPANTPNLAAVMSYFSATMKMNPEGDVLISDDTIQGLGTTQRFLEFCFGSLFLVARTPPRPPVLSNYIAPLEMPSPSTSSFADLQFLPPRRDEDESDPRLVEAPRELLESFGTMLIACVPNPGYFVAGGVAGIVSRTSTAPLDRLKVYLIAQTGVAEQAVVAAKHGNLARAVLNAWRPLAAAMHELWLAGGMRSLYAGAYSKGQYRWHRLTVAGNGLNVLKVMPESAIKFGSYEVSAVDGGLPDNGLICVAGSKACVCQNRGPQRPCHYSLLVQIRCGGSCRNGLAVRRVPY